MALAISGTGNGSLNNLALSANTGTIVDTARAGGIIQVVEATSTTEVDNTSTSFIDSGLSASITPTSSSNKILVFVTMQTRYARSAGAGGGGFKILRDSTAIFLPVSNSTVGPFQEYSSISGATNIVMYQSVPIILLDSPASTSTLTYKVQHRIYENTSGGVMTVNFLSSGDLAKSYIQLLEVVA